MTNTLKTLDWKHAGIIHFVNLIPATEWDLSALPTKKDCTLYRYTTRATAAGGMSPAIMVNETKNLVYFWDTEKDQWETRGTKCKVQ